MANTLPILAQRTAACNQQIDRRNILEKVRVLEDFLKGHQPSPPGFSPRSPTQCNKCSSNLMPAHVREFQFLPNAAETLRRDVELSETVVAILDAVRRAEAANTHGAVRNG